MNIYVLITIISTCLLLFNISRKKQLPIAVLFVVFMIFVGAFRGMSVGTDTLWYRNNWVSMTFDPKTWNRYTPFEPGFNFYIAFVKSFVSNSYYFIYTSVFLFTYLFYLLTIKKATIPLGLFFSFLWMTHCYMDTMNIMRQCLAMSICVYLFVLYDKGNIKLLSFVLFVLSVMFLLHKSSAVFLLTPLFRKDFIGKILSTSNMIVILFLAIFGSVFLSDFIGDNLILLSGVFGERADSFIETTNKIGLTERAGGYIGFFLYGFFLILFSKNRRNSYFYIGFVGFVLVFLLSSYLRDLSRLALNYSFLLIIYLSQNWGKPGVINNKPSKKYSIIYTVCEIGMIIYWINALIGGTLYDKAYLPYSNYLF